jgi:hypothetical protein
MKVTDLKFSPGIGTSDLQTDGVEPPAPEVNRKSLAAREAIAGRRDRGKRGEAGPHGAGGVSDGRLSVIGKRSKLNLSCDELKSDRFLVLAQ